MRDYETGARDLDAKEGVFVAGSLHLRTLKMSDFVSTSGVGDSGSGSQGSVSDSAPAVPQTAIESTGNSQGESAPLEQPIQQQTEQTNEAPAAEYQIPENDDDLAHLTEQQRNPLVQQRLRLRELNKSDQEHQAYRAETEGAYNWLAERGAGDFNAGLEQARADVEMFDTLFSDDASVRGSFWDKLGELDRGTYERVYKDVVTSPYVINDVAHGLTDEQIVQLAESRGMQLGNGGYDDLPGAPQGVAPEIWNAIPPDIRAGFYDESTTRAAQDWYLQSAAEKVQAKQAQQSQWQSQQAAQKQANEARIEQGISQAYATAKSVVEKSVAELFPNNPDAVKDVMRITEQAIDDEPEMESLWDEIQGHIESGEGRQVKMKLPLLISKAKVYAQEVAKRHSDIHSDARQWRELLRQANPEEIIRFVERARGGQKQPQPGTGQPVAQNNGQSQVPNQAQRGQYSSANIDSIFERTVGRR